MVGCNKAFKEQGPLEANSQMLWDFKFKVQEGLLSGDKLEEAALPSAPYSEEKVAETASKSQPGPEKHGELHSIWLHSYVHTVSAQL